MNIITFLRGGSWCQLRILGRSTMKAERTPSGWRRGVWGSFRCIHLFACLYCVVSRSSITWTPTPTHFARKIFICIIFFYHEYYRPQLTKYVISSLPFKIIRNDCNDGLTVKASMYISGCCWYDDDDDFLWQSKNDEYSYNYSWIKRLFQHYFMIIVWSILFHFHLQERVSIL